MNKALLRLLPLVALLTSCHSAYRDAVYEQPRLPGMAAPSVPDTRPTTVERRTVRIDLDHAQTFMDNNTFVSSRYHFADLNGEQLRYAQLSDFEPLDSRDQEGRARRRLNRIESGQYYLIDPLTHSIPYLNDDALRLLNDMGNMFQRSLILAGYRPHRFIVTSLLRTREDVDRLRRVNSNAARTSSHMYATTFDISYSRFNRISTDGNPATNATLASYLGEVIRTLREQGRCVVIYERQQHCFHITVCGRK